MIDCTGNNLQIIIDCDYNAESNWMAFASWYSINVNLPDAQVVISPKRGLGNFLFFNWTYKCDVPCIFHSSKLDIYKTFNNMMVIPCSVMAVRSYSEFGEVGPLSVKSVELPTFVDFSGGCGSFVLSEWINRIVDDPFASAWNRFASYGLTANERKVLKFWEKMAPIFKEVSK